jgi:parvulin-like peptidyl-prolyl isomerase
MENSIDQEQSQDLILVSKNGILAFIIFALLMTALLMSVFMFADFDALLGRKDLALKVKDTSISFADFIKIKEISGQRAKSMSDMEFARELLENLLLAEDARRKKLHENPELRKRADTFAKALNLPTDETNIAKIIFLTEELAKASLNTISASEALQTEENDGQKPQNTVSSLHLRTIVVGNASLAALLEADIASQTPFAELNASYSISLYKSVGGDLGRKKQNDFPEGVFAKFLQAPEGQLIKGYTDQAGTHYFEVLDHHETQASRQPAARQLKQRRRQNSQLIAQHIQELIKTGDWWLNPKLRDSRQIVLPQNASD